MENDDACGITTGGEENCEWDCIPTPFGGYYINPECLIDCFDENHCAFKALKDYEAAGGICKESNLTYFGRFLPTTTTKCEYVKYGFFQITSRGIFSQATLDLLMQNETCIYDVYKKSVKMYSTFQILMFTSSSMEVLQLWFYLSLKIFGGYFRLHPGQR